MRSATFDPLHAAPGPGRARRAATVRPETQEQVEGVKPSQGLWPQPLSGSAHAKFIMDQHIMERWQEFKCIITISDNS